MKNSKIDERYLRTDINLLVTDTILNSVESVILAIDYRDSSF
ncbi:hypothetical protein [Aquimarina sp. Aq78]|nr:hypothetical protein [Aquimarina sp. Aq78]